MNYMELILKYLPYVLAIVKTVEEIAGGLPGPQKKAIVMNSIQEAAQSGEKADPVQLGVVSKLVDTVVGNFNSLGVFRKGDVPAVHRD